MTQKNTKQSETGKVDIFIPIYIGDYLKDTTCLTTEEHGAYLLLIFHYWQHGSIPANDSKLARITRLFPDAWSIAKESVLGYFDKKGDSYTHTRIDKELLRAKKNKAVNVSRAKAAASKRWEGHKKDAPCNAPSNPQAMLEQCPSPSPSTSPLTTPTKSPSKKFLAPSVEAVKNYMKERGKLSNPDTEANKFVDHFTSNGWKVGGKAPMKCWKSAVRTWESRNSTPTKASELFRNQPTNPENL